MPTIVDIDSSAKSEDVGAGKDGVEREDHDPEKSEDPPAKSGDYADNDNADKDDTGRKGGAESSHPPPPSAAAPSDPGECGDDDASERKEGDRGGGGASSPLVIEILSDDDSIAEMLLPSGSGRGADGASKRRRKDSGGGAAGGKDDAGGEGGKTDQREREEGTLSEGGGANPKMPTGHANGVLVTKKRKLREDSLAAAPAFSQQAQAPAAGGGAAYPHAMQAMMQASAAQNIMMQRMYEFNQNQNHINMFSGQGTAPMHTDGAPPDWIGTAGRDCRLVSLFLPPGNAARLGIAVDDNAAFGMPELKHVAPESVLRDQIPEECHEGFCIAMLRSPRIGQAQPRTARDCVELITRARGGGHAPVQVDVMFVQTGKDPTEGSGKIPNSRFNSHVVELALPAGLSAKLGISLEDNEELGMPELIRVHPSSILRQQIPRRFHEGCCIASLQGGGIGQAHPKTAEECVALLSESRVMAERVSEMHSLIKMVLVSKSRTSAPGALGGKPAVKSLGEEERVGDVPTKGNPSGKEKGSKGNKGSKDAFEVGNGDAPRCLVTLVIPPGMQRLGIAVEDNATLDMPELAGVAPDSILKYQIPVGFHSKCCISSIESTDIGHHNPKTAEEFVALIGKMRAMAGEKAARLRIRLIPLSREPAPSAVTINNDEEESGTGRVTKEGLPGPSDGMGVQGKQSAPQAGLSPHLTIANPPSFKEWQHQYNALKKHYEKFDNHDVPTSKNLPLALWVLEQRELKKANKLTKQRVFLLDQIHFKWDIEQGIDDGIRKPAYREPTWQERYNALKRFTDRCGTLPASGDLYEWLEEQKERVQHLMPFRVVKLYKLGVNFDLSENQLEKLGIRFDDPDAEDEDKVGGTDAKPRVAHGKTQMFWKSIEAAKLFGFPRGDDILKGLEERIELLKKANESANGWKKLVPNDGIEDSYSSHDIMVVRQKALFLIRGYILAMKNMNKECWSDICDTATKELNEMGLVLARGNTVRRWNTEFREEQLFQHPKRLVVERPRMDHDRIFDFFPMAKERFIQIANENKHQLTGNFMVEEFAKKILPELEAESREKECFDDGSTEQRLLQRLIKHPPAYAMIMKWVKLFGIEYDTQCTRRGRGTSYLSQRMREAWASGKYANRRPKGQGVTHGGKHQGDETEGNHPEVDEEHKLGRSGNEYETITDGYAMAEDHVV